MVPGISGAGSGQEPGESEHLRRRGPDLRLDRAAGAAIAAIQSRHGGEPGALSVLEDADPEGQLSLAPAPDSGEDVSLTPIDYSAPPVRPEPRSWTDGEVG